MSRNQKEQNTLSDFSDHDGSDYSTEESESDDEIRNEERAWRIEQDCPFSPLFSKKAIRRMLKEDNCYVYHRSIRNAQVLMSPTPPVRIPMHGPFSPAFVKPRWYQDKYSVDDRPNKKHASRTSTMDSDDETIHEYESPQKKSTVLSERSSGDRSEPIEPLPYKRKVPRPHPDSGYSSNDPSSSLDTSSEIDTSSWNKSSRSNLNRLDDSTVSSNSNPPVLFKPSTVVPNKYSAIPKTSKATSRANERASPLRPSNRSTTASPLPKSKNPVPTTSKTSSKSPLRAGSGASLAARIAQLKKEAMEVYRYQENLF